MHLHFCGNPLHDLPMFLAAIVAEAPTVVRFLNWLRGKLTRRAKCQHGHERCS